MLIKMVKHSIYIVVAMLFTISSYGQTRTETNIMVLVEGGSFDMGSKEASDKKPVHKVTLNSFYIGKYEVKVEEYRAFCKATNRKMPEAPEWGWSDNDPIVNVSWSDATDYCKWVGGRLPTEAEWEFASRGGNKSKSYKYSGSDDLDEVGWYNSNSENRPHWVGILSPNELVIYDMSGNVWEWCSDWYSEDYFSKSESSSPKGPISGTDRVVRGGSWVNISYGCYIVNRGGADPKEGTNIIGFRVAKDAK